MGLVMIRILLATSDSAFAEVAIAHMGKGAEVKVDVVRDTKTALNRFSSMEYDTILLDHRPPEVNGIELLKAVRAIGSDVPFIILAQGKGDLAIEALNNGANFFFVRDEDPALIFPRIMSRVREAVHLHRTRQIMQRNTRVLRVLSDLILAINRTAEPLRLLNDVLDTLLRSMDFRAGGIYLLEKDGRRAILACHRNLPHGFIDEVKEVYVDSAPYDRVFMSGQTLFLENYMDISPERAARYGISELCVIPLFSRERIIGTINIVSGTRTSFSKDEKMVFQAVGKELGSAIEKLNVEESLRDERRNLLDFMNSITDMNFVLDMNGNIIATNSAVERALGYTSGELKGMNVLQVHVPERREEAKWVVGEMMARRLNVCTIPLIAKSGETIEVETRVSLGRWNGKDAIFGVTRDVTAQKRMSEALQAANKRLTLCSEVSRHDIMNQVTVLSGYVEIDRETTSDAPAREHLEAMSRSISKISDQLAFTRDYTRIGTKEPQWQNLESVALAAWMETRQDCIRFVPDDIPYDVLADILLVRVFYNLMDNSLRHGRSVSEIRMSAHVSDGGLHLVYEDDGVGIPHKEKAEIFDYGYGKNTGYGLFFVKEALGLTGASIIENGAPGKGARFEMVFPNGRFHLQ
jgi:PAS domain S-box-containing protein